MAKTTLTCTVDSEVKDKIMGQYQGEVSKMVNSYLQKLANVEKKDLRLDEYDFYVEAKKKHDEAYQAFVQAQEELREARAKAENELEDGELEWVNV